MSTLSRRNTLVALACLPFGALGQTTAQTSTQPTTQPSELSALPGARLQGQGRLTFLGLNVYSARLWVTEGFTPDNFISHPVALELEYARSLVGSLIAERSLTEMKRVGEVPADKAEPWLASMTQLFPDVNKGDRITGLHQPGEGMRFFFNGKPRGDIRDAAFARLFTGIWLSPRTSEPQLRQALLGAP